MLILPPFTIQFKSDIDRFTVFDLENRCPRELCFGLDDAVVDYHTAMNSVWFGFSVDIKYSRVEHPINLDFLLNEVAVQDNVNQWLAELETAILEFDIDKLDELFDWNGRPVLELNQTTSTTTTQGMNL